ncbi:hypothetical protein ACLQ2S_16100 [Micromonospora sp. DT48]|uniref:hypothetical protein n=1 Tax=Micromonospora sp. DT48 TaxID=3393429 RepID=UPI003CF07685
MTQQVAQLLPVRHRFDTGPHGVPVRADHRPRLSPGLLEGSAWLALAVIVTATAAVSASGDYRRANALLGICCCLLGIRIFVGHGGHRLTTVSIFGFAFAIFFGVGGVYHAILTLDFIQPWLWQSLLFGFVAQVILFFGFWNRRTTHEDDSAGLLDFSPGTRFGVAAAGMAVLLAAVAATAGGTTSEQLQNLILGAAFAAVTLTAAALVLDPNAKALSWRTLYIGAQFVVFVQYVHGGTGRLVVATLGLTIAALYAIRFRTRAIKIGIVLTTAPVLYWMARERLSYLDRLAVDGSYGRTGLESAVRPPHAFAELLYHYQTYGFEVAGGRTFFSIPALLIPESIWADKPIALGYELARITAPERMGTGYSDASSMLGEWFFNFGYPGLVAMLLVVGIAVRLLDRQMSTMLRIRLGPARLLGIVAAVIISAGIPDLLWSGTHTYGARALLRLPVILLLVVVVSVLAAGAGGTHRYPGSARTVPLTTPGRRHGATRRAQPHARAAAWNANPWRSPFDRGSTR